MLRKLLVTAALVGLIGVTAPQSAEASNNDGVLVFTGIAKVGNLAWGGTGTGDGLCFPTLAVTATSCGLPGSGPLAIPAQSWTLAVPLAGGVVPCGLNSSPCVDFPQTCRAAGVFNGTAVIPPAGVNNCGFEIDGTVGTNDAGVGPSCGMSEGTSTGGPSADTVTVTGAGSGVTTIGWLTSAGGSLPLTGSIQYPGHTGTHPVEGYTQARPIAGGNCATVPAEDFVSIGVLATR